MSFLPGSRSALLLSLLALGAGCSHVTTDDSVNGGESDLTMQELPIRMNDIAAGVFQQKLDHTPGGAEGTFTQRYWYSTQFASSPDAPVLFYFCGEAECSGSHLTMLADTAKTLKAAVIALEHRYYGQSLPFAKPTVRQMQYLTINNALEDAATFEGFAKEKLGLRGKWIAVGGSYPGMLAAFYREKHPELVVGAWASSAPVLMQESFSGYDQVAYQALGAECGGLFKKALGDVEAAYADPTAWAALTLRVYGQSIPVAADLDEASAKFVKSQYMMWVSGQAMGAAQSGNTKRLCSALAQFPSDPLEGLILSVRPPLVDEPGNAPMQTTSLAENGELHSTLGPGANNATASNEPPETDPPATGDPLDQPYKGPTWQYQECTEVGFFKVFNPNREESVMSTAQDVEVARMHCQGWAGQLPNIAQTRATYLDAIANGQVQNLYFVNGQHDPWSSLSYNDADAAPPGVTTHVIALGSHCNDLSNLQPTSLVGVFQAHKQFHDLAVGWLAQ